MNKSNHGVDQNQIRALPLQPGVYVFRDSSGNVLYVGKAKSLRARVKSYFGPDATRSLKQNWLIREIDNLETFPVQSESEALLLEWNLIKEFSPPFNIRLRDDKSYPYIKITLSEAFPRIFVTRRLVQDGSQYFGPFTDVGAMRSALRTIKQMYTVRSCHYRMPNEVPPRPCLDYHIGRCKAPCAGLQSESEYRTMIDDILEIFNGRTNKIRSSVTSRMEEASKVLDFERAGAMRDVLRGLDALESRQAVVDPQGANHDVIGFAREDDLVCGSLLRVREGRLLGREVRYLTNTNDEKDATLLSTLVKGFYFRNEEDIPPELLVPIKFDEQELVHEYLSTRRRAQFKIRVPIRGIKRSLIQAATKNATHVLKQDKAKSVGEAFVGSENNASPPLAARRLAETLGLENPPRTIACFDISTLAGRESVGSAVWLNDGQPDKNEYRRFRIRDVINHQVDDYAMMQEIVSRYFDRRVREATHLPDLVVVDGGKGQLSAARQAMNNAGVSDISTVALAKRDEEVFRPNHRDPLRLPRTDPGLHWLQRARDEAHRFALQYNRTLRKRRTLRTRLEEIPGIGPAREQELLRKFGSLGVIRNASIDELVETHGVGHSTAVTILEALASDDEQ